MTKSDRRNRQLKAPALLSVRTKGPLAADLEIALRAGCTTTEATRAAFRLLAETIFEAWSTGETPVGVMPDGLMPDDRGV
ncbi:hypothetical protein C9F11_10330 [Streptomyces sp. YIM 121038]|nr:hypothetical protein C9F11_10330 [Streptomyces sp. YIM 121038]